MVHLFKQLALDEDILDIIKSRGIDPEINFRWMHFCFLALLLFHMFIYSFAATILFMNYEIDVAVKIYYEGKYLFEIN